MNGFKINHITWNHPGELFTSKDYLSGYGQDETKHY